MYSKLIKENDKWFNFVCNVMCCRTPTDVDEYLRTNREVIYQSASVIREELGYTIRPLYRGILLEDKFVADGKLYPHEYMQYLSFSEDRSTAEEFASTSLDSVLSGLLMKIRPESKGYVIEYTPSEDEILFHHSWTGPMKIHEAIRHVANVEPINQFEVILKQSMKVFPLKPVAQQ